VSVLQGAIFDVLVDLRRTSDFGKIQTQTLTPTSLSTVLIPPLVAHGFQALSDSIVHYNTSFPYSAPDDTGVNIDSLHIDWPRVITHRSERDKNLGSIANWS
jgi:dTDP-4-dehydrorhamnose 3,5-epimerase-like enzyme